MKKSDRYIEIKLEDKYIYLIYDMYNNRTRNNRTIYYNIYDFIFIDNIFINKEDILELDRIYSYIEFNIIDEKSIDKDSIIKVDKVEISSIEYDKIYNGLIITLKPIKYNIIEINEVDLITNRCITESNIFEVYEKNYIDNIINFFKLKYNTKDELNNDLYIFKDNTCIYDEYFIFLGDYKYYIHNINIDSKVKSLSLKNIYTLFKKYTSTWNGLCITDFIDYIIKFINEEDIDISNFDRYKFNHKVYRFDYNKDELYISFYYPSIKELINNKNDIKSLEIINSCINSIIGSLDILYNYIKKHNLYNKDTGIIDYGYILKNIPLGILTLDDINKLIEIGNKLNVELSDTIYDFHN